MFDLEPIAEPPTELVMDRHSHDRSLWRFAPWLPGGLATYAPRVTLGEGGTALVPADDSDTWFKLEYVMPTGSFKDRGAVVLVSAALALGARDLVADSSGNAGTAVAAYAARAGLGCTVFVPAATSEKKVRQMRAHGARVVAAGDRADAAAAAARAVEETGAFYASHVWSPFFSEGTKSYLFEILEQMGALPDRLVLPVGNGTLVLGVERALNDLTAAGLITHRPHLLLVQAAACAPLAAAVRAGLRHVEAVADHGTVAEGIAITCPARGAALLEIARQPGTTVVTVDDDATEAAATWLAAHGMYVEPTAAVSLAGLRAAREGVWAGLSGTTVVPLTGTGLKAR